MIDTDGIELIHPIREGRSSRPIGKKGKSNHRWIVGGKLCLLLNQWGLIVGWDCSTANVHDSHFQPLVVAVQDSTVVFTDSAFHAATGDPPTMKVCARGQWNHSMLTLVCHFKKVMHRVWTSFQARLAFTMAAFNVLVQWDGLQPDDDGMIHLSLARFSL